MGAQMGAFVPCAGHSGPPWTQSERPRRGCREGSREVCPHTVTTTHRRLGWKRRGACGARCPVLCSP